MKKAEGVLIPLLSLFKWHSISNDLFLFLDSVAVITELSRINFSRPIFLDELECTSSDMDILQCDRIPTLGTHSCSHLQDASVICTGLNLCAFICDRLDESSFSGFRY